MKIHHLALAVFLVLFVAGWADPSGCDRDEGSDKKQQVQQEAILAEGTATIGMPAIKNFRERRLLKMILELRDQNDVTTYTYVWNEYQGTWVFFCNSIGYGIPYATQFTNPEKVYHPYQSAIVTMPQADPNGLFSPSSAEGTWVMCKDPKGPDVKPVYLEPRLIVSPFELAAPAMASATAKVSDGPKK